VDPNRSRTRPRSRWRLLGRGRSRGRHARGARPIQASPVQEPSVQEPAAAPVFHACPVAADESYSGFDSNVVLLPPRWPAGDGPSATDCLLVSAEQFITQFYTENRLGPPYQRLQQVRREIEETGTYWHTRDELTFGARVAWRNSARCIGRLYWHSLRVRDRREVTAAEDIAAEAVGHLREATNGGRIRPLITVFAPDGPGQPGPRILNSQLVRYAGYEIGDGAVIGDRSNAVHTELALDLGWRGGRPAGRFDILPLLVQEPGAPVTLHEIPADAILEVEIGHPEFPWFADLGLRWHAVPVISDMYLEIGGVRYPAAPFNGWYMGTEIGSRNLGDSDRYAQLPVIAEHMGLSTVCDQNLWKDKAVTELNLAVLHSFTAAGVTVTDHHTESVRFLQHVEREERHGRTCPADWTWIVPPAASSTTPVFHRYYRDFDQTPNFYRHPSLTRAAAAREVIARHRAIPSRAATQRPVLITAPERAPAQKPAAPQPAAQKPATPQPAAREPVALEPVAQALVAQELAARELAAQESAAARSPAQEPVPRPQADRELVSVPPMARAAGPAQPAAPKLPRRRPGTQDLGPAQVVRDLVSVPAAAPEPAAGRSAGRGLVSSPEPATGRPAVLGLVSSVCPATREPVWGQPATRELVSARSAAGELASEQPAVRELSSSRQPAARELASGQPAALDVAVEGSTTSHDLPRRADSEVSQRVGGDLRR
jgi:nitric-oxide synthase, bacterial